MFVMSWLQVKYVITKTSIYCLEQSIKYNTVSLHRDWWIVGRHLDGVTARDWNNLGSGGNSDILKERTSK